MNELCVIEAKLKMWSLQYHYVFPEVPGSIPKGGKKKRFLFYEHACLFMWFICPAFLGVQVPLGK